MGAAPAAPPAAAAGAAAAGPAEDFKRGLREDFKR